MRGVVFAGERQIEMMEFPDPTPGPGEVVVEIKASGMCGSDLHQYRRPKSGGAAIGGLPVNPDPVIAGHEPCGVVAAIGAGVSDKMARIGQRVMVHHYKGCTVCEHCRSGWSQLCQEEPVLVYGNNAHGGHAPYLKVPAFTLVPLADKAHRAPHLGAAHGGDAALRLAGGVEREIGAAMRQILDRADRVVGARVDGFPGAEFLGSIETLGAHIERDDAGAHRRGKLCRR